MLSCFAFNSPVFGVKMLAKSRRVLKKLNTQAKYQPLKRKKFSIKKKGVTLIVKGQQVGDLNNNIRRHSTDEALCHRALALDQEIAELEELRISLEKYNVNLGKRAWSLWSEIEQLEQALKEKGQELKPVREDSTEMDHESSVCTLTAERNMSRCGSLAEENDDLIPRQTPPRSYPRPSIGQWSVERSRNNMSVRSLVSSLEDKSSRKVRERK